MERAPRDVEERAARTGTLRRAIAASVLALVVAAAAAAHAAESGEVLYRRFCASCHGLEGRGDGPVAPALHERPTDLTRLTTSRSVLMRQIDGRHAINAHGTAEMPVWGEVFEESLINEPYRRRTALLRVQALADYVAELRTKEKPR